MRLAPIDPASRPRVMRKRIETWLAVMTSCPGLPVWATLSATNLDQVIAAARSSPHRHPRRPRRIRCRHRAAETAARRAGEGRGRDCGAARGGWGSTTLLLREGGAAGPPS